MREGLQPPIIADPPPRDKVAPRTLDAGAVVAHGQRSMPPRLAAAISALLHPFVLVPLSVLLAGRATLPPRQLALVAGLTALSLLLETVYILRRLRRGEFSNFDVSLRVQRPRLYLSAMALALATLAVLAWAGLPRPVLQGVAAALVTLALGLLWNFRLKVSLHVAFDLYAALLAYRAGPAATAALLACTALCAWSRVALGRHSVPEVLGGAALGTLGGLLALAPL